MSIRDVIAFPKSASGRCMMMGSPSQAAPGTFERYAILRNEEQLATREEKHRQQKEKEAHQQVASS